MPNYRSLKAWQHAQRLAVECGKAVRRFPGGRQDPIADQLIRAAISAPLNIAEGCARKGAREFRRFLDVARGSLAEVQSALELAKELEYLSSDDYVRLDSMATEAAKTVWGLLRKLNDTAPRHPTP